jgi:hypothetical protein
MIFMMQLHESNIKKCDFITPFYYVTPLHCKVRNAQHTKVQTAMVRMQSLNPVENNYQNTMVPMIPVLHHPLALSRQGAMTLLSLPTRSLTPLSPSKERGRECILV